MESIPFLFFIGSGRWFYSGRHYLLFFAYNWDELPKFAKLGIVEVLLIASVLLAVFTRWNNARQTGSPYRSNLSDRYAFSPSSDKSTKREPMLTIFSWDGLFFTILWAVAIRFAPLWLTFIGLLCTTIWLYNIQIANTNSWEMTLLGNAVTWICALATIITEWMSTKRSFGQKHNRWFVSLLSLATIIHTSFSVNDGNLRREPILSVPLISTVLLFSAGLWYGWKVKKSLFYLAIIPFATLMILLTTFISKAILGMFRYSSMEELLSSPEQLCSFTSFFI